MSKSKKLLYDISYFILSLVLIASVFGLIYSHLRIGEFETLLGQVGRALSTEQQERYELLERIRLFSVIGIIMISGIILATSLNYYSLVEDPEWEMKKGIIGGLLILPFGVLYVVTDDIFYQSLSLSLSVIGVFSVIGNLAYLSIWEKDDQESGMKFGSYCSNCGTGSSKEDIYCSNCGKEL